MWINKAQPRSLRGRRAGLCHNRQHMNWVGGGGVLGCWAEIKMSQWNETTINFSQSTLNITVKLLSWGTTHSSTWHSSVKTYLYIMSLMWTDYSQLSITRHSFQENMYFGMEVSLLMVPNESEFLGDINNTVWIGCAMTSLVGNTYIIIRGLWNSCFGNSD